MASEHVQIRIRRDASARVSRRRGYIPDRVHGKNVRVTYRVRLLDARVGSSAAECSDVRLPGVRLLSAEQKCTTTDEEEEDDCHAIIPGWARRRWETCVCVCVSKIEFYTRKPTSVERKPCNYRVLIRKRLPLMTDNRRVTMIRRPAARAQSFTILWTIYIIIVIGVPSAGTNGRARFARSPRPLAAAEPDGRVITV